MCGTMGYLFHVWGGVGPGRSKTRPDWIATEEAAAAVEAVLKW